MWYKSINNAQFRSYVRQDARINSAYWLSAKALKISEEQENTAHLEQVIASMNARVANLLNAVNDFRWKSFFDASFRIANFLEHKVLSYGAMLLVKSNWNVSKNSSTCVFLHFLNRNWVVEFCLFLENLFLLYIECKQEKRDNLLVIKWYTLGNNKSRIWRILKWFIENHAQQLWR